MAVQGRHSVSSGDLSSAEALEERRRTSTLHDLRPLTLIGLSVPLFPWEKRRVTDLAKVRSRSSREFYEHQNQIIESLQAVDRLLDSGLHASMIVEYGDDIGEESPRQRQHHPIALADPETNSEDNSPGWMEGSVSPKVVRFWINLNMAANILLLMGKIAVVVMSQSLSLMASLVDSVLDLLSTIIIFISASFADRRDWKTKQLYPVGRYRLEPIGVLVFSVLMITSFIQIAKNALSAMLVGRGSEPAVVIGTPTLVVMIGTIVIKGVLWQLCRYVRSSSVQALSQDALTDCVFNFFSILFPLLSHELHDYIIDPLGALLLALFVVWSWSETAMEHINNLTGAACTPEERQQLLYLCLRFSERIKYITALNAYHAGDRLMCEVDILLDPQLSMRDSHDIAEALQYALETLPIVERAFVHIDYRRGNFSGHIV